MEDVKTEQTGSGYRNYIDRLLQKPRYQLTLDEKRALYVSGLTLMDDAFMSVVFRDYTEGVEFLLHTILGRKDLFVVQADTQTEYRNPAGHAIRLDIRAKDADGKLYDIEIQKSDSGADPHRARYYRSTLDQNLLEQGAPYSSLADVYVIFITENDYFGAGKPLYHIENKITELENAPFGDGAYTIYVNGAFRAKDHPIGQLMNDFHCTDPAEMKSPVLAHRTQYFKESGGKTEMTELAKEMRAEIHQDMRAELAEELRENIRSELKEEIREDMRSELKEEIREDMRSELKEEIREDMRKELHDEIRNQVIAENEKKISIEVAGNLLAGTAMSDREIAGFTGLTEDEVAEIRRGLPMQTTAKEIR